MKRLMILGLMIGLMPIVAAADPGPPAETKPSQREWMRAHGQQPGRWLARHMDCAATRSWEDPPGTWNAECVKVNCTNTFTGKTSDCSGTGKYVAESDVKLTRTSMKPFVLDADGNVVLDSDGKPVLTSGYIASNDCQSACHSLAVEAGRSTHNVDGFKNAFGVTSKYSGPIDPGFLITDALNDTAHAAAFNTETQTAQDADGNWMVVGRPGGCAACHSPETAAWAGVPAIEGCRSCHNFKIFDAEAQVNKGPSMHATHAVLLEGVKAIGDVDSPPNRPSCDYCHVQTAQGGVAACWNCHLSGHWPKVPYFAEFETGTETPPLE